jgi:Outer membrane protein beta-barrel domain
MKQVFTILALLCIGMKGFSQKDSIKLKSSSDTTITHSGKDSDSDYEYHDMHDWKHMHDWHDMPWVHMHDKQYKPSNLSTNWLIVDLGFTNYNDKTNYAGSTAQTFAPGSNSNWFNLKNNKSVDVNIWFFMQRLNMVKHVINLKYGLGIELNNYRYEDNIKYTTNSNTQATTVIQDTISYSKNKLAADYVTVPLMINFNFTPSRREGFGISVGISAGYLYSSRQKTISSEFGKKKNFDDFDLNPWKLSWIAEAQLGPVILYGSMATKSMFNGQGLDQVPYTFGIRLSKW